jgi:hypothetical protein
MSSRPWPLRAVLYPGCYAWYIFFSSLDLMLTWLVLHLEGQELNVVAAWVIGRWDLQGVVAFKFALVAMVVCICEVVGRRNGRVGRVLAVAATGITAIPVGVTMVQLVSEFTR